MSFEIKGNILVKYNGTDEVVSVPEGVTSIQHTAFGENRTMQKLILPDSLTCFQGVCVYECYNLKEIVLPKNLEKLDSTGFEPVVHNGYCSQNDLFYVINGYLFGKNGSIITSNDPVFSNITNNSKNIFNYNDDTNYLSVKLPEDAKIGLSKLNGYSSINELIFPEGFEEIRDTFIEYFYDLTKVVFPSTLSTVKCNPFYCCPSLKEVALQDSEYHKYLSIYENGLYSKDYSILYSYWGNSLVLHPNTKIIGISAFSNTMLSEFILPETINEIKGFAFSTDGCIETLMIPKSVKSINYCGLFNHDDIDTLVFDYLSKDLGDSFIGFNFIDSKDESSYSEDDMFWESNRGSIRNIVINDFDTFSSIEKALNELISFRTDSITIYDKILGLSYMAYESYNDFIKRTYSTIINELSIEKYDSSVLNYDVDPVSFTEKIIEFVNTNNTKDIEFINLLLKIAKEIKAYEAFVLLVNYKQKQNLFEAKNLFLE